MGGGSWSSDAYSHLKASYSNLSKDQIFTNKTISRDMSPFKLGVRESRDSSEHPESIAVMVALDVTGSMGSIPAYLIKNKLGILMETLINHKIPDAQIMFLAVGDHECDDSPLQLGQFESGTQLINQWLKNIYIEGGGGGNAGESYALAWLIAGRHTSIDCFEKRGLKGFLFTIGDEPNLDNYPYESLKKIMGYEDLPTTGSLLSIFKNKNLTATQLVQEAQRLYHVFHLIVNKPSDMVISGWKKLLGEHAIVVDNYENVAEVMASTVALVQGSLLEDVMHDFTPSAKSTVTTALASLRSSLPSQVGKSGTGVHKF
jgi:hypothetical protein